MASTNDIIAEPVDPIIQYPFSKIENYNLFTGDVLENAYLLDENWVFEDANFAFLDETSKDSRIYNGIEFIEFSGIAHSNKDIILKGKIAFFCKERKFTSISWVGDATNSEKCLIIPKKHYLRIPFRRILPMLKRMHGRSFWMSLSPEWVEIAQREKVDIELMAFYLRFLKT